MAHSKSPAPELHQAELLTSSMQSDNVDDEIKRNRYKLSRIH